MLTKKLIGTLLLASTLLLCTACTTAPDTTSSTPESSAGDTNSENSEVAPTTVYGKISGIAGNELELSLAKDPYADLAPKDGGEDGGTVAATETVPASPAEEAGTEEEAAPKMQLDYTGESQNFTVPTGVKVIKTNGGEGQLGDLKKGSVLMMFTDNTAITEIVILE